MYPTPIVDDRVVDKTENKEAKIRKMEGKGEAMRTGKEKQRSEVEEGSGDEIL